VDVAQFHGGAVSIGEGRQSASPLGLALPGESDGVGGRRWVRRWRDGQRGGLPGDLRRSAPSRSAAIAADVHGDPSEPCPELERSDAVCVVAGEGPVGTHEDVLGDVLSRGAIVGRAQCDAEDEVLLGEDQRLERTVEIAGESGGEIRVVHRSHQHLPGRLGFAPARNRCRTAGPVEARDAQGDLHRPMVVVTLPSMAQASTARPPGAPETTATIGGVGGLALFTRRWAAIGVPRAAVAIVHGFGEHSGRYANVVGPLTGAGFAVHGFDLRGHGRSAGRRGHIDSWADYRDDLRRYLDHVRSLEVVGTPVFLYGHSLGGAIALEYGLRRQDDLAGVIASSPALRPKGVRSPVLEGLAAVLSRVWPTISLDVPLELEALSRDSDRIEAVRADALNHRRFTARATVATLEALAWTEAHAGDWRLPLLIFHGTDDRVIDPGGTVAFAEAARAGGATDVEVRLYDDCYHEPHNDLDAAAVEADVVDWVDRHLGLVSMAEGGPTW
jgi:acylglycerol lipase